MYQENFQRMIALATEVFDSRNDPEQLDVNEKVIAQLENIHPFTLNEYADEKGPAVWILTIPCSTNTMKNFINGKLNEKELFNEVLQHNNYECLYLCSALVLPEYRNKGLALEKTLESIQEINKTFPIKTLLVWPFSEEGNNLAKKISSLCQIPLLIKE